MNDMEAEACRIGRYVLQPKKMSPVAVSGEQASDVPLLWVKVPPEAPVCQAHDAVAVRITSGGQGCPAGTALWCSAEGSVEANPIMGKRVEVGAVDRRATVTAEMASKVVTGDRDDQAGMDLPRLTHSVVLPPSWLCGLTGHAAGPRGDAAQIPYVVAGDVHVFEPAGFEKLTKPRRIEQRVVGVPDPSRCTVFVNPFVGEAV